MRRAQRTAPSAVTLEHVACDERLEHHSLRKTPNGKPGSSKPRTPERTRSALHPISVVNEGAESVMSISKGSMRARLDERPTHRVLRFLCHRVTC
jgi:hypothetical protein